jgi:hypothetical protein
MTFKFEIWEIENGVVITRPLQVDTDDEGNPIYKNSSVYREDPLVAVKEVQVALDVIKGQYLKQAEAHQKAKKQ